MSPRRAFIFPLFAVSIVGVCLWFGLSGSDQGLPRRRTQTWNGDEWMVNPLYQDMNAMNPALASHFIFTDKDTPEQLEAKRRRYQEMVRWHSGMYPCLHKSFYGVIGVLNPQLKEASNATATDGDVSVGAFAFNNDGS